MWTGTHETKSRSKNTLMDGAARWNSSVYYYDYTDFQGFYFLNTTAVVVSLDAKYLGAETELVVSTENGWDFLAGLALPDTEVNGAPGTGIVDQDAPLGRCQSQLQFLICNPAY